MSGPLSLGYDYDTLFGSIFNAQVAHKLTDNFALGAIGEYGPNQYRLNGTLGYQLYSQGQVKFSGEYLSQVLPFNFDSGDINQRVSQSAYGLHFQHNLGQATFKNISLGGYWAQAPNTSLSTINYIGTDGLEYVNERNLAGATSQGLDLGGEVAFTSTTFVTAKVNYDSVNYDTQFTSDSSYNADGVGTTLGLNQVLNDRLQFSADVVIVPPMAFMMAAATDTTAVDVTITNAEGSTTVSNGYTYNADSTFPSATNISPATGSSAGGQPFTITGSNLGGPSSTTTVLFEESAASNVVVSSDGTSVTGTTPTHANGTVNVSVQVQTDGTNASTILVNAYTFNDNPQLTGISPSSGSTIGGNSVTLTGYNLTGTTQVKFGSALATNINVVSDTQITCSTPGVSSGSTVSVAVITPNGTSTLSNAYTYAAPPTITSFTPTAGTTDGGTNVTITGTNLANATSVMFGTSPATIVSNTNTQIVATTSASAAGTVNLAVTTAGGTATSSQTYKYSTTAVNVTSVAPNYGSPAGNQQVTITGTNFSNVQKVTCGGKTVSSFSTISATSLVAIAPTGTAGTTVNVTVTTTEGESTLANAYTYRSAPTITKASPTSGTTDGGQTVTITGTNLESTGTTTVTFGSNEATGVTVSADQTSLTAITPAGTVGAVNVTVANRNGTKTATNAYTYAKGAAPILTSMTPIQGTTSGKTGITLTGSNLASTTSVTFGGKAASITKISDDGNTILCQTPSNSAGYVNVVLTTPYGTASPPTPAGYPANTQYLYGAAPTVTQISPTSGPDGTSVTISGTNLTTVNSITFGGTAATFTYNTSAGTITAIAPSHDAGAVNVVASNAADYSSTAPQQFTYS